MTARRGRGGGECIGTGNTQISYRPVNHMITEGALQSLLGPVRQIYFKGGPGVPRVSADPQQQLQWILVPDFRHKQEIGPVDPHLLGYNSE
jgi:hypothetical protein